MHDLQVAVGHLHDLWMFYHATEWDLIPGNKMLRRRKESRRQVGHQVQIMLQHICQFHDRGSYHGPDLDSQALGSVAVHPPP